MRLFAIFTSQEYLKKSSDTKFISIINGYFIKIMKGLYNTRKTMLGNDVNVVSWNYPSNFKRDSLTIPDGFAIWVENIRYKVKIDKITKDTLIDGFSHYFGNKVVKNK